MQKESFLQEPRNRRDALDLLYMIIYHASKTQPSPNDTLREYFSLISSVHAGEINHTILHFTIIGKFPVRKLWSLYEIIKGIVANAILPTLPGTLPEQYCSPLPSIALVYKACATLGRRHINYDKIASVLE